MEGLKEKREALGEAVLALLDHAVELVKEYMEEIGVAPDGVTTLSMRRSMGDIFADIETYKYDGDNNPRLFEVTRFADGRIFHNFSNNDYFIGEEVSHE